MGLFPPDSDADADDPRNLPLCYEIQSVVLAGETLAVRQFDYHSHNTNRVWSGTFNLQKRRLPAVATDDDDSRNGGSSRSNKKQRRRCSAACPPVGPRLGVGNSDWVAGHAVVLSSAAAC